MTDNTRDFGDDFSDTIDSLATMNAFQRGPGFRESLGPLERHIDQRAEEIEDARNAITFGSNENFGPDSPTNTGLNGWPFGERFNGVPEVIDHRRAITKSSQDLRAPDSNLGWYQQLVEETNRFHFENKPDHTSMTFGTFPTRRVSFTEPEVPKPKDNLMNLGRWLSPISTLQEFGFGPNVKENGWAHEEDKGPPDYSWPPNWTGGSNSLAQSIYNGVLKPAARNVIQEENYFRDQWDRNNEKIRTSLVNSPIFSDSVWAPPTTVTNPIFRFITDATQGEGKVQQMLANFRKKIPTTPANYTWSGQLPRKSRSKTPIYSCKVFLGGIPYDLTDSDLHLTFSQFGPIQIQWPGKDIKSAIDGAAANKAGYVYLIFESYDNVAALLNNCTVMYRDMDSGCRWYFNISSRRQKGKEVQVIPFDIGDRFYMKNSFSGQMEHSRTVFVGALHGMLSADGLAKVMDDLFGGVVFAGLDTDKYKYPLGSGRVSFDNQDSYLKAVSAAFVEIKSARFKKKIQIDPYIDNESICSMCRIQQSSPIFCRDELLYFCGSCWESHHSDQELAKHRPIIKNKPSTA